MAKEVQGWLSGVSVPPKQNDRQVVVRRRGNYDFSGGYGSNGSQVFGPDGKRYDSIADAMGHLQPQDTSVFAAIRGLKRASRLETMKGGYLGAAVLTFRREVIGTGLMLRSLHPDAAVREAVEMAWADWCAECDVTGRLSWRALLHQAVTSLVVDGEILMREHPGDGPHGYSIELLDTMLLNVDKNEPLRGDSRTVMGVEMTARGRPTAYWLIEPPRTPYGSYTTNSTTTLPVAADLVIHAFDASMPQMTRGVPWGFATLRRFQELREYDEYERGAAKLGAAVYGVHRPSPHGSYDLNADPTTADLAPGTVERTETETLPDGTTRERTIQEKPPLDLRDNGVLELEADANFDLHNPTHPTSVYEAYVNANQQQAAATLGISYASLTGDLSKANFVSSRLGRLAERGTVLMMRDLIVERVALRVFRHWLDRAYLRGKLPMVPLDELAKVEFVGPAMEHVQPRETADANHQRLEDGVASKGMILREGGHDPRKVFAEIEAEQAETPDPEPAPERKAARRAQLTSDEVVQARAWKAEGVSCREIGRRLGVSHQAVSKVVRGLVHKRG